MASISVPCPKFSVVGLRQRYHCSPAPDLSGFLCSSKVGGWKALKHGSVSDLALLKRKRSGSSSEAHGIAIPNKNNFLNTFAACEEMRGNYTTAERRSLMICPKPRRLTLAAADAERPSRRQPSYQADMFNCKAGSDIIVTKGGELASSPPFFCGSPLS